MVDVDNLYAYDKLKEIKIFALVWIAFYFNP